MLCCLPQIWMLVGPSRVKLGAVIDHQHSYSWIKSGPDDFSAAFINLSIPRYSPSLQIGGPSPDQARMHPGAVKGGFMRCRPSGISTTRGSMTLGTFHELLSSLRVVLSWDRHLYPEQGEKAEWPTPWLYCHLCPPSLSLNFCLENGLYHELFYFKTFN